MKVLSICIAQPELLVSARKPYLTGIYKRPVAQAVTVNSEKVHGDAICNAKYHGGPDQAVYLYGEPDYQWWEQSLGRSLPPGTFGENVVLSEMESARLSVGDRFHIGTLILEVTSPRIPCATLAAKMEDSAFVKKFRLAERPGAYCRVINEGSIRAGDEVRYEPCENSSVGLLELYRDAFAPAKDRATLQRHLAAPLAVRVRAPKEELLAKAVRHA